MLDGMFSFILVDNSVMPSRMIAARDPIGITTLYMGTNPSNKNVYFASELKALHDECEDLISFPPGHFYDSQTGKVERYYKPEWLDEERIPTTPVDYELLRTTLEKAVKKRLMAEVPYGVLLSGGLDSSLIAAIAARETDKIAEAQARGRSKTRESSIKRPQLNGAQESSDHLVGMIDNSGGQFEGTFRA